MRERSALLENPSPCSCCLCLHCFPLLKTTQVSKLLMKYSLRVVGGHRPRGSTTGHGIMVIDQKLYHRLGINSRPALKVADRPSIPAEHWFATTEDKQDMAMHFKAMFAPPPSSSCLRL